MSMLKNANDLYEALIKTSMDGFWKVDHLGNLLDVNDVYCQMVGYRREELLTMGIHDVEAMESPALVVRHLQQVRVNGSGRFETRHRHKSGQLLDIEVSTHYVPDQDNACFLGFLRDISERKKNEIQSLARAARQRDVLVREVHHRIKNNLQGVAALLQQEVAESPQASEALKKAIARVKAVGVVHGLNSVSYSQVVLCDVVRAITQDLQEMTSIPLRVDTVPEFRPVLLADAELVPIALIINEMIFNSVKHGGAELGDQKISIMLRGGEKELRLIVSSLHGCLPQGFDFSTSCGLGTGLSLVKSLLPPSGAELSIEEVDGGVRAELKLMPPVLLRYRKMDGGV